MIINAMLSNEYCARLSYKLQSSLIGSLHHNDLSYLPKIIFEK